jgi:tetratricopeptide (TPR) repeat protein
MSKAVKRDRPRHGLPDAARSKTPSVIPPRMLAAIAAVLVSGALLTIGLQQRFGAHETDSAPPITAETPPPNAPPIPFAVQRSVAPSDPVSAEALEAGDRLLEQFPGDPRALTVAGRIYDSFGDEDAAAACWENALAIDPRLGAAWHALGEAEAAWRRGDFPTAVERLQKAIEAEPQLENRLAFMLADALKNAGDARQAAEVLERAAAAGPLSLESRLLLAQVYLQRDEHDRAKEQFHQAVTTDPDSSKAHFGLATVYARLNQPDKAEKHRQEYARLQSENVEQASRRRSERRGQDIADLPPLASQSLLNAGKVYALQGDTREAERLWQRAVHLAPQNHEAKMLLRTLKLQQGRPWP